MLQEGSKRSAVDGMVRIAAQASGRQDAMPNAWLLGFKCNVDAVKLLRH